MLVYLTIQMVYDTLYSSRSCKFAVHSKFHIFSPDFFFGIIGGEKKEKAILRNLEGLPCIIIPSTIYSLIYK